MSSSAEMHLAYRVANAPILQFPFPHIYVENVFPPDFYRKLRAHLPPKEHFSTLRALKRVKGEYPDTRLVLLLEPDRVEAIGEPYRTFWHEVGAWLLNGQFARLVLSKFSVYLDQRFGDARNQAFDNEAMLVQDYSTYTLTPHTDTPSKVVSFLFYLPEDDSLSHLGTSIYVPKDRRLVSDGIDHLPPEAFERLITMPFRPNTLFGFVKTPNSFHGVEPVLEREVRRDLILYDIKVKGGIAPPGAARPKSPGSNVQFSF